MPNYAILIAGLLFTMLHSAMSIDILVTNSRHIIIGKINSHDSLNISIFNNNKLKHIPKNRIEMLFSLPELSFREKLEILPKGLPIYLKRIEKCKGIFFGLSQDKILLDTGAGIMQLPIDVIEDKYSDDFPDIRLFNLIQLIKNKRESITLRTYEYGDFDCRVVGLNSAACSAIRDNDTLHLNLESIISINGDTMFDYQNIINRFSSRYLFLPSAYIGNAEEVKAEVIDLYYTTVSYNISHWLQIGGGFAMPILYEQSGKYPISFSVKGAVPLTKSLKLFAEAIAFHKEGKMPGLLHLGLNFGSDENNISVLYSYQSEMEKDFASNILNLAGVFRLYNNFYYTSEASMLKEAQGKAYILSNAIQYNFYNISFKLGAIYFIAEKKEYSILPLLKAEFDF